MAHDQIFKLRDDEGVELKIIPVSLNRDKEIFLLYIFEEDYSMKKKFIRNELVIVDDVILTSSFSDTVHFMEELNLFIIILQNRFSSMKLFFNRFIIQKINSIKYSGSF